MNAKFDTIIAIIFIVLFAFILSTLYKSARENTYQKWFDCGIIATKMNIETDNWFWYYKLLSDKYLENDCLVEDNIKEKLDSL